VNTLLETGQELVSVGMEGSAHFVYHLREELEIPNEGVVRMFGTHLVRIFMVNGAKPINTRLLVLVRMSIAV